MRIDRTSGEGATTGRATSRRRAMVVLALALSLGQPLGGPASAAEITGLLKAREAAAALSKGQLTEAAGLYTEALQDKRLTNDRKGVILADRGVIYARLGQPDRAIADFNQAVTLFPENAVAYNNRGAFLISLGAVAEAIKDFDRALILAPGYVAAWNNRAAAHAKAERLYPAIADYTQAIRLASGLAEPLTGRAHVYLTQSRPYAAMRDLSRALQNDTRAAMAYRARAEAQMALGNFAEAAQDLSRAIAFSPVDVTAYLLRGEAYMKSKDIDAALRDFTKVVELDPRSAVGYRERGNINILRDDFDQAEQDLARSLEIAPRDGVTYAYRALMYKKRDQAELGAQEIAKAIRLAPADPTVLWARGEIEEARGLLDEAAESYRKALAARPGFELAALGLRRLGLEPAAGGVPLPRNGAQGWEVTLEAGRFYATHADHDDLKVPLERAGSGEPRILGWEEKDGDYKGLGLLRFEAGNVPVAQGSAPIEYVALLDLRSNKLIALEPDRLGKAQSKWSWQDGQVTVAGIDGLTTVHALRNIARPKPVVASAPRSRPSRRRQDTGATPSWVPWANDQGARTQGPRQRRARRKPKTLFDLILGN